MRAFGKIVIIGIALVAMSAPGYAADRITGTYISGGFGANFAGENDLESSGTTTTLDHDTGFVGVMALGHAYANGLRGEIELGRRTNSIDKSGTVSTGGRSSALSAMINGYYDFATGSPFVPYLGLGLGLARLNVDAAPVGASSVEGSDTALALQGIAGVGYQMDNNWTASLEYRYLNLQGADIRSRAGSTLDADYDSHSIMIGLRYTFGAEKKKVVQPAPAPAPQPIVQKKPEPAPAPPPPAPAPIVRNYIVFFDWDKADITPEALKILKTAAENARKGGVSRIEATGHADSSGRRAYNDKLSERRARAVQAQLSKLGIATGDVAVDWKGELQQLVPTADGVREPQNRRVEIVFP